MLEITQEQLGNVQEQEEGKLFSLLVLFQSIESYSYKMLRKARKFETNIMIFVLNIHKYFHLMLKTLDIQI